MEQLNPVTFSIDSKKDDPRMLLVYFIVSTVVVSIFIPMELYLLCKIKFRIDMTAKIILLAFTLCFILREVVNTVCLDPEKCNESDLFDDKVIVFIGVINSVFDRIKWLVLYFFILEMQDVRIKVESSNLEVFQIRKAQLNCTKIIVVIVFIALQMPVIIIQYYNKFNYETLSTDWN